MPSENPLPDKMRSPLHKLQSEISKDLLSMRPRTRPMFNNSSSSELDSIVSYSANGLQTLNDNESVYSFESVSTNGRLLDRLDLDSEDFSYDDEQTTRRDSYSLIHSTGRLLDRLGLDDNTNEQGTSSLPSVDLRVKPIRASSSISLERMRSGSSIPARIQSQSARMPLKSTTYKTILRRENGSVVSLKADFSNLYQNSSTSLVSSENLPPPLPHTLMRLDSTGSRSFVSENQEQSKDDYSEKPSSNTSSPETIHYIPSPQPNGKRNLSSSSNASNSSLETLNIPIFNPNTKFDPSLEQMVKKALQTKAQGNLREASYLLQTIANIPNNYPKAMYLYGKALKLGQGVKLNEAHAIKWFSRCILVSYILETVTIDANSMNNYATKLSELGPQECVAMVKKNIETETLDPIALFDHFSSFPQQMINKMIQINSKDSNTVGGAYFQLGECVLLGLDSLVKDEVVGRMFLSKAASLGSSEAMVKLGELWSSKSKHFKKDLHQAAAWLRLGELFDSRIIGNSWIYKEKYMAKGKSKR